MSTEDSIGCPNEGEPYALCAKNVEGGRGVVRINHQDVVINRCCPGGQEAFRKHPPPHLVRLAKVCAFREMRTLVKQPSRANSSQP